ncbi:hypothetical protein TKK_0000625 [Trichogramma kaykai]
MNVRTRGRAEGEGLVEYAGHIGAHTLLNYLAVGLRPFWYHATNVALHAAACMLVTRVSLAVASLRPGFAALTGLLFAAHPIHTDAVSNQYTHTGIWYTRPLLSLNFAV